MLTSTALSLPTDIGVDRATAAALNSTSTSLAGTGDPITLQLRALAAILAVPTPNSTPASTPTTTSTSTSLAGTGDPASRKLRALTVILAIPTPNSASTPTTNPTSIPLADTGDPASRKLRTLFTLGRSPTMPPTRRHRRRLAHVGCTFGCTPTPAPATPTWQGAIITAIANRTWPAVMDTIGITVLAIIIVVVITMARGGPGAPAAAGEEGRKQQGQAVVPPAPLPPGMDCGWAHYSKYEG